MKTKKKKDFTFSPEALVVLLAELEHTVPMFDLNFVHVDVRENNERVLEVLRTHGIDPVECTGAICHAAKDLWRERWRNTIKEWNNGTRPFQVVLVGDPEFDPSVNPAPSRVPDVKPQQTPPEQAEEPGATKTDPNPPVPAAPTPVKKPVEPKPAPKPAPAKPVKKVEKKPEHKQSKATLLGYGVCALLRWIGQTYSKADPDKLHGKVAKLLNHFDLKIPENTIKHNLRDGRKATWHYGPPAKVSKDHAGIFKELLDKKK